MRRRIFAHALSIALTFCASAHAQVNAEPSNTVTSAKSIIISQPVTIPVVGAFRPVDPARTHGDTASVQNGLDLYLQLHKAGLVTAGQSFAVFREVSSPSEPNDSTIRLKVGEVRILDIQGKLAVGRVVRGPELSVTPFLRTPGIIIGDFMDPSRPLADKNTEPDADQKRRRNRRKNAKASKSPKASKPCPKPMTGSSVTSNTSETPRDNTDPDGFRSWDNRPIEF